MAATEPFVPGQLYQIPLADLQPDPNQPRKYFDPVAVEEITNSVKEHRVLTPILFRTENSICFTVAGELRCIAARKAGLADIPAIYVDSPNYEEIALIENTIRSNLTAVEEAEAVARLQARHAYKQEELARIMGKSVPTISQTLSLMKLPQTIRDECRKDPAVPKRVLVEIAAKKQERSKLKAYEAYKAGVNPVKKEQTGNPPTRTEMAVKAADATGKKIETLDINDLYMEEKEALAAALTALKDKIEAVLAAIAAPATEETPGEEGTEEETTPSEKRIA